MGNIRETFAVLRSCSSHHCIMHPTTGSLTRQIVSSRGICPHHQPKTVLIPAPISRWVPHNEFSPILPVLRVVVVGVSEIACRFCNTHSLLTLTALAPICRQHNRKRKQRCRTAKAVSKYDDNYGRKRSEEPWGGRPKTGLEARDKILKPSTILPIVIGLVVASSLGIPFTLLLSTQASSFAKHGHSPTAGLMMSGTASESWVPTLEVRHAI